jgi:hypothetical protein
LYLFALQVYPSEILPLKARQKGSSISTAANWICNFIIVYITPPAIRNIGWKTYIIFAVLNATWVPIIVSSTSIRRDYRASTWLTVFHSTSSSQKPKVRAAANSSSIICMLRILTHLAGLALEDVDQLFAPEGIMDAMRDQKVPDVETFEVRRDT